MKKCIVFKGHIRPFQKKLLTTLIGSIIFCFMSIAQEKTITGAIADANGVSLPGVNVTIKGTSNGVITDIDGKYTIKVPGNDAVLAVTCIGYKSQEITIGQQTIINLSLEEDVQQMDEVVVVGYGTVKKKDLTGAVAVVKSSDLKAEGTNSSIKSLQGLMAGVTIESAGGSPGSGNRVLIRGTSTINGNPNPLYVVDGVPVGNIDNIPTSDIESINVLKDASAAAIYGARGSTGVVLVTTKMGKKGENKIDFKASYGIQKLPKKLDVLNAKQWELVNDSARAADKKKFIEIAKNPDSLGEGTDYQDEIYRLGQVQEYDLSLNGGSDNYNYGFSGGYFGQEGIVKQTNYERLTLRIKSEYKKKRLRIGESIMLSNEKYLRTPGAWGQGGNPIASALKMVPLFEVKCDTCMGGYNGVADKDFGEVANPVAILNLTKNRDEYNNIFINVFAEFELIKDLKYKYNIGYNKSFSYNNYQSLAYQLGNTQIFLDSFPNMSEKRTQNNYFLQEHTLNFNKTIGKHSINAVAGFTLETNKYRELYGDGDGLAKNLWVISAAERAINASSYESANAMLSYLGRLVYSFDDRYLLTASIRRDGSSKFGEAYRFGNFPSMALGWNVSNEKFFNSLTQYINTFKLRLSYGSLGNQSIPDYLYATTLSPNLNYVMGNQLWNGSIQTDYASKDVKWEACKTTNIGTDLGFFKNSLTITVDYFEKVNSDLLIQLPIPLSTGASSNPWVNYGQITNKGIELAASYKNNIGDLLYNVFGSFTSLNNVVDEMGTESQEIISGAPNHNATGVTLTRAGEPVGSFYLIQTDGIFNSLEEINAYYAKDSLTGLPKLNTKGDTILIQPNAKPGDIRFVDANGDGVINEEGDRVVNGSSTPKYEYSFGLNISWKGVDLSMFFQGVYGNKIYNGLRMDLVRIMQDWNYSAELLNAWTPTNRSDVPRLTYNDKNQNTRVSDRFLEDGSYLRFKTLQIGYTFPKNLTSSVGIASARVYTSIDNVHTFTNYSGFNPDLGRASNDWRDGILSRGVDNGHVSYPLSRTMTCGIQLTF